VESEPGKGTLFTIRLPQERVGTAVCGTELASRLSDSRLKKISRYRKAQIVTEYMPYGRVLVVDDVEANLYVAKGMILPYGIHVETVNNGFDAVSLVKKGSVYDIIFMDHMMPKMNGVETTKLIREAGYTHPIVALTANAVAGQADVFLANGFDAFISKPIDIRELNVSLNKLIRDKQPPEVIEAARREASAQHKGFMERQSGVKINDELLELVAEDAKSAIEVMEETLELLQGSGKADMEEFATAAHGMKGALVNIGERALAADASLLEGAADRGDKAFLLKETPPFIEALRAFIDEVTGG